MFLPVSNKVKVELQKHFQFSLDKRVYVLADTEQFNFKEDESVWAQKRNLNPNYFSVFWDGVFICGFDERTPTEVFMVNFWKNFRDLYKEGKVFLNQQPDIYEETPEEKLDRQTTKKVEELPETNPTQRMAKEVVKRLHKKKGKGAGRKKIKTPIIAT